MGEPPYYSDEIPELYKNIKEAKLKFPKGISEEAKSLISVRSRIILGIVVEGAQKASRKPELQSDLRPPIFPRPELGRPLE